MVQSFTILISSAGRRVGLIDCFRGAAAELGLSLRVLACDQVPEMSAACQAADRAFQVPACTDARFAETLLDLVRQEGVRLIVPTIDTELPVLSQAAPRFEALGCRVHVSPPSVIAIARDKSLTASTLLASGVPTPRTLTLGAFRADQDALGWPVFAKPVSGSSSRGLAVLRQASDIPDGFAEEMVFQEYLTGPEYTVNLFIDAAGALRCAIPHLRLRVRGGEVEKGRTVRRADLEQLARAVAASLPEARGALCFQVIDDATRGLKVIEINARFGGGYPLADHAGATFCKWLLQEVLDRPCTADDAWRDGVEMLRYDAAFYRG